MTIERESGIYWIKICLRMGQCKQIPMLQANTNEQLVVMVSLLDAGETMKEKSKARADLKTRPTPQETFYPQLVRVCRSKVKGNNSAQFAALKLLE